MTQTVLLGDIVDTIIDYRGKTPKKLAADWSSVGYRALSAKNIENGKIKNVESIRYVDESLYKKWMKEEIKRDDILLTSEAPLGQPLLWDSDEKIVLSQRLFGIRAKKDVVDPNFLYAYISSPLYQAELQARATGSTVKGIRQAELVKTKLVLPSLGQQKRIGNFIRAIDEKIELNRQMNETLEQMGQALFRHYFIDNPDAEKWEDGKFADVADVLTGKGSTKSQLSENGKIPLYGANGVMGTSEGYLYDEPVVITGRVGTLGKVRAVTGKAWFSDNVLIMKPKKQNFGYVFSLAQTFDYTSMNRGSTQPLITQTDLKNISVKIPDDKTLSVFEGYFYSLFSKLQNNESEIQTLATLRDTLLPRLISGKVKV